MAVVRDRIPLLNDIAIAVVQKELRHGLFFAITTDGWDDDRQRGYVSATFHWIDATWVARERAISVEQLEPPHTAKRIAAALSRTINFWLDDTQMVVAIVSDGGRNFRAASQLVMVGGEVDAVADMNASEAVYCIEHRIQLVVNDVLRRGRCFSDIEAVKELVDAITFHTALHQTLHSLQSEKARPLDLIRDVPTRWSSVYDMLERFCSLWQTAIKPLIAHHHVYTDILRDSQCCVDDVMVQRLFGYIQVLEPFKLFTKKFEVSNISALLKLLHICFLYSMPASLLSCASS